MNTGILSLPEGQYRAAEGISKSLLDWIAPPRTPAHYRAKVDGLIADEQTPAMRLGSMIHRAILEPETVAGAWVVKPEGMNFATKEGKEWKAAQTQPIITADEDATIVGMRDSVHAHPAVKRVLANARTEVSLFANGEDGVLRKARIDALPESGNVIVDIKSCQSADPDMMAKSVVSYRYDVQAAYYLDICKLLGIDKSEFLFVCVEKQPPYAVAVYALDQDAIEWGRKQYQRDLATIKHCEAEDHWPSFTQDITTLALPAWAQKQMEAVL
jgi:exodeoxyribonuclease VIII